MNTLDTLYEYMSGKVMNVSVFSSIYHGLYKMGLYVAIISS